MYRMIIFSFKKKKRKEKGKTRAWMQDADQVSKFQDQSQSAGRKVWEKTLGPDTLLVAQNLNTPPPQNWEGGSSAQCKAGLSHSLLNLKSSSLLCSVHSLNRGGGSSSLFLRLESSDGKKPPWKRERQQGTEQQGKVLPRAAQASVQ